MKKLYLLTIALLVTAGNAFAMQQQDLNIPAEQRQTPLHAVRIQSWNPHRSLETQILKTLDKENGSVLDLPSAYNHFSTWFAIFTNNPNPQGLSLELQRLKSTYTIFSKALSRDTTQQPRLSELQRNIENIERLVSGSPTVTSTASASNNNNNNRQ